MNRFKHKDQASEVPKPLSLKDMQDVIVEEGFEIDQVEKNCIVFKHNNNFYRALKDYKMIYVDLGFTNDSDPNMIARCNYMNAHVSPIKVCCDEEHLSFVFSSYCETRAAFKKCLEFAVTQIDVQMNRYSMLYEADRLSSKANPDGTIADNPINIKPKNLS